MTKALVVGAFGARGTGKTAWLMQQLRAEKALAVWDYKHDPRMSTWGRGFTDLGAFVQSLKASAFVHRYLPDRGNPRFPIEEQFRLFCLAAFQRGRMAIFVDELPAVTMSNKAPQAWRECVNIGREYRTKGSSGIKWLSIYATAQRPSECDKSFISNLDIVHTGRLSFANDARVMSLSIGASTSEIMALPDLEYLEKSAATSEYTRGKVIFAKKTTQKAGNMIKPEGQT